VPFLRDFFRFLVHLPGTYVLGYELSSLTGLQPAQQANDSSPGLQPGVSNATGSIPLCRRHARSRLRRSAARKAANQGEPQGDDFALEHRADSKAT
jgi:hypothetical protein